MAMPSGPTTPICAMRWMPLSLSLTAKVPSVIDGAGLGDQATGSTRVGHSSRYAIAAASSKATMPTILFIRSSVLLIAPEPSKLWRLHKNRRRGETDERAEESARDAVPLGGR